MLKRLIDTTNDVGVLLARVTLGVVMFPHGAQKVLGWFGGHGLSGTMDTFRLPTSTFYVACPQARLPPCARH